MAVGVFDSGIGGLTVLDALQKRLPEVPFVYFGDNAHAPYGVRTHDDIFNLTCAATELRSRSSRPAASSRLSQRIISTNSSPPKRPTKASSPTPSCNGNG